MADSRLADTPLAAAAVVGILQVSPRPALSGATPAGHSARPRPAGRPRLVSGALARGATALSGETNDRSRPSVRPRPGDLSAPARTRLAGGRLPQLRRGDQPGRPDRLLGSAPPTHPRPPPPSPRPLLFSGRLPAARTDSGEILRHGPAPDRLLPPALLPDPPPTGSPPGRLARHSCLI